MDRNNKWLFENAKPTNLTDDDIQRIDEILNNCINKYNRGIKMREDSLSKVDSSYDFSGYFITDLSKYKRQYIPVINERGEKEVWVNCFCNSWNMDWTKEIISVRDGGNCYFNIKINLTQKKYYRFRVNGEA